MYSSADLYHDIFAALCGSTVQIWMPLCGARHRYVILPHRHRHMTSIPGCTVARVAASYIVLHGHVTKYLQLPKGACLQLLQSYGARRCATAPGLFSLMHLVAFRIS